MSLWDKQAVWHGWQLVRKRGHRTLHPCYDDDTTLCGHTIGDGWERTTGPVARHMIHPECLTIGRKAGRIPGDFTTPESWGTDE